MRNVHATHMHFMDERERDFLPTHTYVDAFIIGEYRNLVS